jgi:hypothetical protein
LSVGGAKRKHDKAKGKNQIFSKNVRAGLFAKCLAQACEHARYHVYCPTDSDRHVFIDWSVREYQVANDHDRETFSTTITEHIQSVPLPAIPKALIFGKPAEYTVPN